MTRFEVTLQMGPVPRIYRLVYRARRMTVPIMCTPHRPAALVPARFRRFHHWYAARVGYFWIPCPLCQREFAGHEIQDSIPDPIRGPGTGMGICPFCTADRNRKA